MPFQLNAKSIFLTFARCTIGKEFAHNYFNSKFQPNWIIVGRELHEDGTPHLHIVFTLDAPIRSRDERVFDFEGFHPNIVRPRAITKCADYCKKGGDFLETGEPPAIKRKWSEALACTTKDDFMNTVAEISPRDFVLNQERIEYFAAKHFKPPAPMYIPQFTNFILPQELSDWIEQRHEVYFI